MVINLNKKVKIRKEIKRKTVNNNDDNKLNDMKRIEIKKLTEKDKKSARIC